MKASLAAFAIALSLAAPAAAERRGFTITSFTRIEVSGPFTVRVETGRGASAIAEGDATAIDRISLAVIGNTLRVRRGASGWGGYPGEEDAGNAVLTLVTPALERASLTGAGTLGVDRMDASEVEIVLGGSGELIVGAIEADTVMIGLTGPGRIEAAGHVEQGRVMVQGTGVLDAAALTIDNLTLRLGGSGSATITGERQAEITLSGSGDIIVLGDPGCEVTRSGGGAVTCGQPMPGG